MTSLSTTPQKAGTETTHTLCLAEGLPRRLAVQDPRQHGAAHQLARSRHRDVAAVCETHSKRGGLGAGCDGVDAAEHRGQLRGSRVPLFLCEHLVVRGGLQPLDGGEEERRRSYQLAHIRGTLDV